MAGKLRLSIPYCISYTIFPKKSKITVNKLILSRVLPNMFSVNENKDMVFMIGMIAIAFAGFVLGHFI